MDIGDWLQSLNLGQYEKAFRSNAIDADVLPDLTDDALREIGLPLGHRLKILKAIAALNNAETAAPGPTAEGERRQVAVLFADLVGFTSLASELGAEATHNLLDRFFTRVDQTIEAHGGRVDKHIGDCVMAVFGAPRAHGNDAERALRTALAIREQLRELSAEQDCAVQVRIGIAAGQVVASSTGSARHREYTVTGDSVNLASRLTAAAEPGDILVADSVWRDLAERLEGIDTGALSLKGFAEPVQAWRLLGFRHKVEGRRTPFVGRRTQLQQLQAIFRECRESGRGQAVYLRGEAGIGKTRLVEEFQRIADDMGFACHKGLILDFGTGAGRDAIAMLVRQLLALELVSDASATQSALETAIATGLLEPNDIAFLNDLLDLPQPPTLRAMYDAMDHATRAEGRRAALNRLVERASQRQPRMLIVEDLHWADAGTLNYLADLAAVVADCPAVLVMTSRVEGDPLGQDWRSRIGGAALLTVDLGPLRQEEALALAGNFFQAVNRFAARCVERAAGNPLFLEQLLRHAEEAGEAGVPGSVQSLVQARMDRLQQSDKEALQAAAVLGQRFGAEALAHLLGRPEYTPQHLAREMLVRPQDKAWLFAHALIRDAVYDTLLTPRRRELHRSAADWYRERDIVLHAEHLDRASDPGAAQAYLNAAQAQAGEYHYEAALRLVERGIALAASDIERSRMECLRGELLYDLTDMAAAANAFEQALAEAASPALRCRALLGLAAVKRVTDNLPGAFADLEAATSTVTEALLSERARIHFLRGNLLFPTGDVEGCLAEHGRSLALARQAGSPELEAQALGGLGDAEYMAGRMLTASRHFSDCVKLSVQHGFGRIEVANRPMAAITRLYAGNVAAVLEEARAAVTAAQRVGHRRGEIIAHHAAYLCHYERNEAEAAMREVEQALAIARALKAVRFEAETLTFRAELHRVAGRLREALQDAQLGVELTRRSGMAYFGPIALGALAHVTSDAKERAAALAEADALLDAGAVSHNHLMYPREAIELHLEIADWDRAERYVERLVNYARREPLPFIDFIAARGRALAAWGRGKRDAELRRELERLHQVGTRLGSLVSLPLIEKALQGEFAKRSGRDGRPWSSDPAADCS